VHIQVYVLHYGLQTDHKCHRSYYLKNTVIGVGGRTEKNCKFSLMTFNKCSFLMNVKTELLPLFFVCVGVTYSGEYDVCDVTLSVHPHRAS
jgi:hypothetical protein